jgi:hypothetical protein
MEREMTFQRALSRGALRPSTRLPGAGSGHRRGRRSWRAPEPWRAVAVLGERPARLLGHGPEAPEVAPPGALQLDREAAQLEQHDGEGQHGEGQHRHPEGLRDLEDDVVHHGRVRVP